MPSCGGLNGSARLGRVLNCDDKMSKLFSRAKVTTAFHSDIVFTEESKVKDL